MWSFKICRDLNFHKKCLYPQSQKRSVPQMFIIITVKTYTGNISSNQLSPIKTQANFTQLPVESIAEWTLMKKRKWEWEKDEGNQKRHY